MRAVAVAAQIFFVFSLIFLFPPNIMSSTVYKCPNLEWFKDARDTTKTDEDSSDFIILPGSIMSNFKEAQFRLEELDTSFSSFCDKNYEVIIKINLIGSDTININLSTEPPPQPLNTQSYTTTLSPEEIESSLSQRATTTSPSASKLYETFPKSSNSSYHESFMYSVEKNTTIVDTDGEVQEQSCERKLSRKQVQFTPDGVLFYAEEYFRPNEYCIKTINDIEEWIGIVKCNVDCSNKQTPCIPLCCHLHEYVDLSASCCQGILGSKPMFQPVIYDEENRKLSLESSGAGISITGTKNLSQADNDHDATAIVRPHYVTFKYHTCPDGLGPVHLYFDENGDSPWNTRIHIQSNGKVAYVGDDRKWHFLEKYCVAGIVNANALMDVVDGIEDMTAAIYYCLNEQDSTSITRWPNYLLIGVFSFSSIFLLVTLLVYILLWEKQNIHGWTIMSFVTSEFFLFTSLALSYSLSLFITADVASRTPYCIGSAILAHFFFLSTFSWLTVINLDLWWTFKSLTPLSERSKGRKRFCLYMLFAWGLPITVISTGLILQSTYTSNTSNVVVPDYGHRLCFLADQAKGIYLYYIIGTLLMINLILISLTFFTIYQFKKSTRVASSSSSNNKERSFRLFIKLVVVMGFTWIFEVVMWLDTDGERFSWIFLVVDILNVSQAVATFMIFVCKRKIINQVEQKHPSLKVITRPLLKLMGQRPSAMLSSTSSKPTRSTTAGSSVSTFRGSRNKSLKVSVSAGGQTSASAVPVADSNL